MQPKAFKSACFHYNKLFIINRDSDDEAEGKSNKMVEIVNEVTEEEKAAASVVSAENKAAQALDKVFAQDSEETESEQQMETAETDS